ncbi:MAG TPA: hypothetical protein VFO58_08835 [Vicinamibacterales bacterium]|nr:hypothetical protein [Vicinamibacterales bacterium]
MKTSLFLLIGLIAVPSFAQVIDQAGMAEELQTAPQARRESVVAAVRRIPVSERQPFLLTALLSELQRLRNERNERWLALQSGKTLQPVSRGEYLFLLLDTIAQHEDAIVLPSLLAWLNGTRVLDAIADFGEEAVQQTLIIAGSPNPEDDPSMAMEVLKRMLERKTVRKPLSAESRGRIVALASRRLSVGEPVAILSMAVRLGVATRDPMLLEKVRELASNDEASVKLGIVAEEQRRSIRSVAERELAGRNR